MSKRITSPSDIPLMSPLQRRVLLHPLGAGLLGACASTKILDGAAFCRAARSRLDTEWSTALNDENALRDSGRVGFPYLTRAVSACTKNSGEITLCRARRGDVGGITDAIWVGVSTVVASDGVRTDGMAGAASTACPVAAFVNMGGTTCFVRRRALACGEGNEGIFTETASPTEINAVAGRASCLPCGTPLWFLTHVDSLYNINARWARH
mmetsp:Transcript_8157/g.22539  ORF Transcript_8157/g.22539 Transcript_8157/m.22539 type:complete len:210 (-) Transcript_8157:781-1410(-)